MKNLRVTMFGRVCITGVSGARVEFETQKSRELFFLSAFHLGRGLGRIEAASTLRMDCTDTQARRALSTDLWRIRQGFTQAGLDPDWYLMTSPRDVALKPSKYLHIDHLHFEMLVGQISDLPYGAVEPDDLAMLQEAAALYRGDLFEGQSWEWCAVASEQARSCYTDIADRLMQHFMAEAEWTEAISWAQVLVQQDPLWEHAHRALMRCYLLSGNRGMAIRQYTDCAALLQDELGVEPSFETQQMYRGLLSVAIKPPADRVLRRDPALPAAPLHQRGSGALTDHLAKALGNLNQARSLVEHVDHALRTDGGTPK